MDQNMIKIISNSASETSELGKALGSALRPGDVVALSGELGAGKTTFVKGLAFALGTEEFVLSPSFIIVNEYQGRVPVFHADLYRLHGVKDALDIGLQEYFGRDGVVVIEWADRAAEILPSNCIRVWIEPSSEDQREISVWCDDAKRFSEIEGVMAS